MAGNQHNPPMPLPIDDVLPRVVAAVGKTRSVVLRAPAGAGKTTRVPPALLAAAAVAGQIVMVEPRRIAVRAAARRIASEQGWRLGREVGYRIRFERREHAETKILVVTEGILLQMLQADPFLEGVGALVFDEFHERHLASDLALAMARRVREQARDDLALVVMSATLDPEPIARWLGDCPVVESRGRLYPVEILFEERPDPRPLPTRVAGGVRRMLETSPGDVLAFLPGVGEIRRTAELLGSLGGTDVRVLQLYGDLPAEQQDAVLSRGPGRRVVLSTNVAETSVTLDGIGAVVDGGMARSLRFDPALGLDRLELGRISRASADQRAGRAGRQGPGHCLRLWTEHDDRSLPPRDVPEIRRIDLASALLQLRAWGESDLRAFPWFEAPLPESLERAHHLLVDLGALSSDGAVTSLGQTMARLPVAPRLARLLVAGHRAGILRSAALAAALQSERDVVNRPTGHRPVVAARQADSDLLDRLWAVEDHLRSGYGECALGPVLAGRVRQADRVARQLETLATRHLGPTGPAADDPEEALLRSLLAAFPDRLARRREAGSRRGVMVGGRGVRLAEMSAVTGEELFLCLELDAGGQRGDALVRRASRVDRDWLPETDLRQETGAVFDTERGRVVGRQRTLYRDLVLDEREHDPGPEAAERVLVEAASGQLDQVLPDDRELGDFLSRMCCLAEWMPELDLPSLDPSALTALLPVLASGRRSFDELRRAPWLAVLRGVLDHQQSQALDRHAPSHLEVPSGSRIRLLYTPGEPPVLAVRIQELFGLADTPTLALGRAPVLLHLLAPNHRPQQITHDLASFWNNTYPQVRKELKGRYPKHAWPDDPVTALPERRPRRRGTPDKA